MLFQNLANIEFIDILMILSSILVCVTYFMGGCIFLLKTKDKSTDVRNYLLGIGLFFLLYGTDRLIFFLYELTFEPNFMWHYSNTQLQSMFQNNPELALRYDVVWRWAIGLGGLGLIILSYQIELYVMEKKTRFLITIIEIISIVIPLIFGLQQIYEVSIVRIILYTGNVLIMIIPLYYFYFAFKTVGITRKRAIGAGTGILIMFIGIFFSSSLAKSILDSALGIDGIYLAYLLFCIFTIIGTLIYSKSIHY
jgi:hypothetical protein